MGWTPCIYFLNLDFVRKVLRVRAAGPSMSAAGKLKRTDVGKDSLAARNQQTSVEADPAVSLYTTAADWDLRLMVVRL